MTDAYKGYLNDIYSEPDASSDTLANLGPLRPMAGVFRGEKGADVNPKLEGPVTDAYVERYELQPIDPQTNGPQLFYGLRYHQHIVRPGEVETFHDQVGYWLWEPATGVIMLTLSIPRGQTALAIGRAAVDAKSFELVATRGDAVAGICSNPFLEEAFRTDQYRIKVTINNDDSWSYEQTTTLMLAGKTPFPHTDRSTLHRTEAPKLNPLAQTKKKLP